MSALYEKDFCAWSELQKDLILSKRFNELDVEHLAEEIGDLTIVHRHSLASHIKNIMLHMLKIEYQPDKKTNSWIESIDNARDEINDLLEDHPSLIREIPNCLDISYTRAKSKANKETGIDIRVFPKACPWTIDEILDEKK
jgi:uncharacterized protein DUF29